MDHKGIYFKTHIIVLAGIEEKHLVLERDADLGSLPLIQILPSEDVVRPFESSSLDISGKGKRFDALASEGSEVFGY